MYMCCGLPYDSLASPSMLDVHIRLPHTVTVPCMIVSDMVNLLVIPDETFMGTSAFEFPNEASLI